MSRSDKGKFASIAEYTDRFFNSIKKAGECWEWQRSLTRSGYGSFYYRGKNWRANRWAYQHLVGSILNGLYVCHTCNNKKCVNPKHLYLGTAKENTNHSIRDGLHTPGKGSPQGENCHLSKLNEYDVLFIRAFCMDLPVWLVSAGFDITPYGIWLVRTGKSWKHLPFDSNVCKAKLNTHKIKQFGQHVLGVYNGSEEPSRFKKHDSKRVEVFRTRVDELVKGQVGE